MKHFINLSSRVINKLHIIDIVKQPNLYEIYMTNNSIGGFVFFSSGFIGTKHNVVEICKNKNKQDYDTITEFITSVQEKPDE